MLSVALLETLALVTTALGGAMFVIISVLPTVLPRALELARKQLQEALDEAKLHSQAMDLESMQDTQKALEKLRKVGDLLTSIESALRVGLGSAGAFIVSSLWSLSMLTFNTYVVFSGVAFIEDTTWQDIVQILFFGFGLFSMLVSGRSFYKIIRLVVSPPKPRGYWSMTAFTNTKVPVGEITFGSIDTGAPAESEKKEDDTT